MSSSATRSAMLAVPALLPSSVLTGRGTAGAAALARTTRLCRWQTMLMPPLLRATALGAATQGRKPW